MDAPLEWNIVVGQRRFTSGHHTVGGEDLRPQQAWKNQVTDFMRSKNMEESMAEDRHLWRLGMDRWLLPVYILILIINYYYYYYYYYY